MLKSFPSFSQNETRPRATALFLRAAKRALNASRLLAECASTPWEKISKEVEAINQILREITNLGGPPATGKRTGNTQKGRRRACKIPPPKVKTTQSKPTGRKQKKEDQG